MCVHEQRRLHCTSQSGWQTPLSEHVYCVANTFKMTEGVEQRICIKFCVKLEHSSTETIQMIQKATAISKWWLAALSRQCARSCIIFHVSFFWQNIKSPRWLSPTTAQIWCPATSGFSHTSKTTFERKEISDHGWDSGKYDGVADGDWENWVRFQGAYFEGDWGIIVLCTLFLVSCINVSIFDITWLDTFWTDFCIILAQIQMK